MKFQKRNLNYLVTAEKMQLSSCSCPLCLLRLGDSAVKNQADMPYHAAEFPRTLLMIIQSSVCQRTDTTNQQSEDSLTD